MTGESSSLRTKDDTAEAVDGAGTAPPRRGTVTPAASEDRRRAASPHGHLTIGQYVVVPVRRISVIAAVVLILLTVAAAVATFSLGRLGIALSDVPALLAGDVGVKERFVLERLRGPRLVTGLGIGAALSLSGALFQSVTRNPLGSPDIIGVAAGAGAGAALASLMLPDVLPVPVGAVLGATGAMALVYVSTGAGFRNRGRLVVAGIGVAALCTAITQYVVYAVERDKASALTSYINGSLNVRDWGHAATVWIAVAACTPVLALISRRLDLCEMGDELAAGLGARPSATKTIAVVVSLVLSAAAVSAAGPIAFIALTAPQIARRITRGPGPHLVLSALVGALLMALADLAAQHIQWYDELPVGIYTMALGGIYLGYLLVREWRRGVL